MTREIKLTADEPTEIQVTGIDGLRTLMAMVQSAWADGGEVTLEGKTRFIPNGKETIYCQVLPITPIQEAK